MFIIIGLVLSIRNAPLTAYESCDQVKKMEGRNGLYMINSTTTQKFLQCLDGATLIQRRVPAAGYQPYFFERTQEEYIEGFGFSEQEYWIGLEYIYQLFKTGNNVLRIEGTIQNKDSFWVEFEIDMSGPTSKFEEMDGPYDWLNSDGWKFLVEEHRKFYAISSATQTNASDHSKLYNVLRPSVRMRKSYRDPTTTINIGFIGLENVLDKSCPYQSHSSWWYPLQVRANKKIFCDFDVNLDTNLNGVFHHEEDRNGMRIFICDSKHAYRKNHSGIECNYCPVSFLPNGVPFLYDSCDPCHAEDTHTGYNVNLGQCIRRDGLGAYSIEKGHGETKSLETVRMYLKSNK